MVGLAKETKTPLLAISERQEILEAAEVAMPLPAERPEWLSPLVAIVPGQLFALGLCLGPGHGPRRAARPPQGHAHPMSARDLLLAVDGGGTKTLAVVADLQGKVLARGLGPGSNPYTVGFIQFTEAVKEAVRARSGR